MTIIINFNTAFAQYGEFADMMRGRNLTDNPLLRSPLQVIEDRNNDPMRFRRYSNDEQNDLPTRSETRSNSYDYPIEREIEREGQNDLDNFPQPYASINQVENGDVFETTEQDVSEKCDDYNFNTIEKRIYLYKNKMLITRIDFPLKGFPDLSEYDLTNEELFKFREIVLNGMLAYQNLPFFELRELLAKYCTKIEVSISAWINARPNPFYYTVSVKNADTGSIFNTIAGSFYINGAFDTSSTNIQKVLQKFVKYGEKETIKQENLNEGLRQYRLANLRPSKSPPTDSVKCYNLDLKKSKIGDSCFTQKGFEFKRVSVNGKLGVQDVEGGKVWFDKINFEKNQLAHQKACEFIDGQELPSFSDFEMAKAREFQEALAFDMDGKRFWSKTTISEVVVWNAYLFDGTTGQFYVGGRESDYNTEIYVSRCVSDAE